jgi:hypothetical protein
MDREGKDPFPALDELEENSTSAFVHYVADKRRATSKAFIICLKKMNFFAVNKTKLESDIFEIDSRIVRQTKSVW